jgi:hypothetical protein
MTEYDGFDPIAWAIETTGIDTAEAVRRLLTPAAPSMATGPAPTKTPRPKTKRQQVAEFVDGEFEVRAADVVRYGLTESSQTATVLLNDCAAAGLIDKLAPGLFGPKGSAQEMGS